MRQSIKIIRSHINTDQLKIISPTLKYTTHTGSLKKQISFSDGIRLIQITQQSCSVCNQCKKETILQLYWIISIRTCIYMDTFHMDFRLFLSFYFFNQRHIYQDLFPGVKVRLVSYLTNDGRFFMYMDSGIKKNFASAIKKSSI